MLAGGEGNEEKVGLIWILLAPLGNIPDTEGHTRYGSHS